MLNIVVGVVVILVNVVEFIILVRKKEKRKTYECFLLSLSVSDFLFGAWKIIFVTLVWISGEDDERLQQQVLVLAVYSHLYLVSTIWSGFHSIDCGQLQDQYSIK